MAKMVLFIIFCILVFNVFVRTAPIIVDENEDVMTTLARLHQETDRIRRRLNPMPDLITFASNDIADRLKRYVHTKKSDDETDTVYVNLKIDFEEKLETKYVNLYIDTKRDINAKYTNLDSIDTKFVYLNINSASNDEPYPFYRRFRRHRQIK